MDKKKIAIYGGVSLAVLGGVYLYSHRAKSTADNNTQAAQPAVIYGGGSQGTGASDNPAPAGFTPPATTPMGTTSDLTSILTLLGPLLGLSQTPAQTTPKDTTDPALTASQNQVGWLQKQLSDLLNKPTTPASGSGITSADATTLVNSAYGAFLGRATEKGPGPLTWIQSLVSGALTPAQVTSGIANSPEGQISKLYESLLGRAPDATGLSGYEDLLAKGASINTIQQDIMQSAEYHGIHSGGQTGGALSTAASPSTGTSGFSGNSASSAISFTAPNTTSQSTSQAIQNPISIGFGTATPPVSQQQLSIPAFQSASKQALGA